MIRLARFAFPLLALSLSAAACGSSPDAATPEAPVAEGAAAAVADPVEAPQGHAALAGLFGESLDALEVRPEQKQAIAQIRADMKATRAPVHAARRDLALAVADGVAAGSVTEAALTPHMGRLSQSTGALVPAMQTALNKLHATLDATQRKALVDGMRAKAEARHEGRHEGGPRQRMAKLTAELGLSADQVKTIREGMMAQAGGAARGDMMKQHEAGRERMRAIADAFVSETFDAAALGVGTELGGMTNQVAAHRMRFVAQMLPVLTAEQRTKWAASIRAKAGAAEPSFEE